MNIHNPFACKLLVIEGPDMSGKATQSKMLVNALSQLGYRAERIEVPTRYAPRTHKLIYWALNNGLAKHFPNAFQVIQFFNKFFFQLFWLPKIMRVNDYIVFDRWRLSSVIYGLVTHVNEKLVMFLYNKLRRADITFIMHGKSHRRNPMNDDSYEKDTELQASVKTLYHAWAMSTKDHVLVPNVGIKGEVHMRIVEALSNRRLI